MDNDFYFINIALIICCNPQFMCEYTAKSFLVYCARIMLNAVKGLPYACMQKYTGKTGLGQAGVICMHGYSGYTGKVK